MKEQFLFQAMIYLAAAVLMVPVAKKLGLGSVLGYLIAGIIIGPFCLKFIGTEGKDLMHFAEFGVVMMLFVVWEKGEMDNCLLASGKCLLSDFAVDLQDLSMYHVPVVCTV